MEKLRESNLLNDLQLLHFHIGSQINDIGLLKDALQEASQIYVELHRMGAPMGHLDVGGGLGIDYDGSRTTAITSTNYSLQNYANDVVATVQECCDFHQIKMPTLISESGRAIVSHFSVLVFNILGSSLVSTEIPKIKEDEPLFIRNLRETLESIEKLPKGKTLDYSKLQEAWNDAIKFKDNVLDAFRLGYLGLNDRGKAEQLTWACAKALLERIPKQGLIPQELNTLKSTLARTYYGNLSIFRSAPDSWAINQLFPVMPIHRLNEEPTELGNIADLTCDSDGNISQFIDNGMMKPLLELHATKSSKKYLLGLFLAGAYQEVMGNLHNLFGSTNSVHVRITKDGGYQLDHVVRGNTKSDVLEAMGHEPEQILERLRIRSEEAIQNNELNISDAQRLMEHIETSLRASTYLQEEI